MQQAAANSATKWLELSVPESRYRIHSRSLRFTSGILALTSKRQQLVVVLHTLTLVLPRSLTVARSFDMQIPLELPNGGRGLGGRLPMGSSDGVRFTDRSTGRTDGRRHAPHERLTRGAFHKGRLLSSLPCPLRLPSLASILQ